ncbi:restriction endonuclease subunit R [Mesorhizobium sp. B2-5-13]|uniref:type I restriction endonuclease subunit R n=1 Tax=unclassified Mesorhizobium TaxID=325217 RepID=UPI00112D8351|nr:MULTISPECIES: DEAD/DEAH box helicase family protein [unclassified Mesorhizobium]TPJ43462.1 restriction endonuclease subunit R [Mesorhizobium sp. B2-6-5]TPJ93356.1 restriction endonuclease subunit R [Mesorhizobium sp. B2-5-13]TPK47559.1 restriction endonuclease subunit R [Mesorhizobium sp. B2-5-5]
MNEGAFHPEDKARSHIDRRLLLCGWVVQTRAEMNLGAGLGVAVREFQTASGPVDYALFVGRILCGVVEAKPEGSTLSGFAEQAARYMAGAPSHLVRSDGQVRFEYVASSSETIFRDHADPDSTSRIVFSFHRPETLERWIKDTTTLRARLQSMPRVDPTGLRACQVDAVAALEQSLAVNKPRALVQMATGAGKTFTACTLSYRLLAHSGFRRILFLADRANLVRQTRDEFLAYRPPGTGRSFSEIYNVQKLGAAGLDKDSQVVVATIQRVYSVLTGKELAEEDEEISSFEQSGPSTERLISYNPSIPIESFDLVITDECHRSIYGTWRQVLEYFDAFTVGLTATPSLHTLGFFNKNLVAQYPYERSVVDGVNVGFEIFRIRTEIGERGSTVKAGYDLPVRDKRTRAERYETLSEDFAYTPDQIDHTVLVPNQIRTVLESFRDTLFTELFPGRREVPKTLIFAKDDHHAEEIVGLVREVFGKGNDFAKKITYKTDGADPEQLIRAFRNDYNPRIAVTVDMIATGTDIKPIEALIFLRDVRSELYFEQMKGRGARTISPEKLREVTPDADAKTRFVLVDAVGVSESLKTVSQPLERDRVIGFDRLIDEIAAGRRDDDAFATLAARLAALDRRIGDKDRAAIAKATGGVDLAGLAARLLDAVDPDALAARVGQDAPELEQREAREAAKDKAVEIFDDPTLRKLLKDVKAAADIRIDTISTDAVVSSGWDEKRATDTVERFRRFLDERHDELAALQILYRLPYARKRLTYEAVDDLREALKRPPWLLEPVDIWRAYKRIAADKVRGNPAGTLADIVMLVRYALGQNDSLEPLPSVTAGRFNLWLGREEKAGRVYSEEQRAWLAAIRDHLAVNIEIRPEDMTDAPEFAARGGIVRARGLFGARLPDVLDELTEVLVA